jgi:hypothetical protein
MKGMQLKTFSLILLFTIFLCQGCKSRSFSKNQAWQQEENRNAAKEKIITLISKYYAEDFLLAQMNISQIKQISNQFAEVVLNRDLNNIYSADEVLENNFKNNIEEFEFQVVQSFPTLTTYIDWFTGLKNTDSKKISLKVVPDPNLDSVIE